MAYTKNNQNFWLFDKTHIGAGGPGGGGKGGQPGKMIGLRVGESSEQSTVLFSNSAILTDSGIPERKAKVDNNSWTLSCVSPPPPTIVPFIQLFKLFVRESEVGVVIAWIDSFGLQHTGPVDTRFPL
jgi:hypothetical protein